MYRRIILAYDGTAEGRAALREGAMVAARNNAELHLLAIVRPASIAPLGDTLGAAGDSWGPWQQVLDEGLGRLRQLGFAPHGELISGEPTDVIAAYAEEIGADLVVVNHRKQSLIDRWWAGSSNAVLSARLPCSMLVSRNVMSDERFEEEMRRLGRLPPD
jgi:nucleotide-binding universal stress UspA family protein